MALNFAKDIIVTLEPVKPGRPGGKPVTRRVYASYGLTASRVVREVCEAVGGQCVYFSSHGTTIPVPDWRQVEWAGSSGGDGNLKALARQVADELSTDRVVTVYGSDRRVWRLGLANASSGSAPREDDCEVVRETGVSGGPEAPLGGMREEF